jgi:hypothetical protein
MRCYVFDFSVLKTPELLCLLPFVAVCLEHPLFCELLRKTLNLYVHCWFLVAGDPNIHIHRLIPTCVDHILYFIVYSFDPFIQFKTNFTRFVFLLLFSEYSDLKTRSSPFFYFFKLLLKSSLLLWYSLQDKFKC